MVDLRAQTNVGRKTALSLVLIFVSVAYALQQHLGNAPATTVVSTASQAQEISIPAPVQPTSSPSPEPSSVPAQNLGPYVDGAYTGKVADAYYGNVQVQATIVAGNISDIQFLQYPTDRKTSQQISGRAMPILKQEAIQAQSAQVDTVSGATEISNAFVTSLGSALAQAKK